MLRWILNIGVPLLLLWALGLLFMLVARPWFMDTIIHNYMLVGAWISILVIPYTFYWFLLKR